MESSPKKTQYFIGVKKSAIQSILDLLQSDMAISMGITRDLEVKIVNLEGDENRYIPIQVINPHTLDLDIQSLRKSCGISFSLNNLEWNSSWKNKRTTTNLHKNLQSLVSGDILPFIPKSFDVIGNIAIIEIDRWGELSDQISDLELHELLSTVGETILKLHKKITTVLRKAGNIQGEYRVRKYEVIAGKTNTKTHHKENGVTLTLDPTKMFFSPRLSFERKRVSLLDFKTNDVVIDCFAGCGPYSIQIARNHDVKIYSIEKNPAAYDFLEQSIKLNQNILIGFINPYLGDFREFIKTEDGIKCLNNADYIIMNLPERANEFIPYISPYIKTKGTILVFYQIIQSDNPLEDTIALLTKELSRNNLHVIEVIQKRIIFSYSPKQNNVGIDIRIKSKEN